MCYVCFGCACVHVRILASMLYNPLVVCVGARALILLQAPLHTSFTY
jgi:hypothetical protein